MSVILNEIALIFSQCATLLSRANAKVKQNTFTHTRFVWIKGNLNMNVMHNLMLICEIVHLCCLRNVYVCTNKPINYIEHMYIEFDIYVKPIECIWNFDNCYSDMWNINRNEGIESFMNRVEIQDHNKLPTSIYCPWIYRSRRHI